MKKTRGRLWIVRDSTYYGYPELEKPQPSGWPLMEGHIRVVWDLEQILVILTFIRKEVKKLSFHECYANTGRLIKRVFSCMTHSRLTYMLN